MKMFPQTVEDRVYRVEASAFAPVSPYPVAVIRMRGIPESASCLMDARFAPLSRLRTQA